MAKGKDKEDMKEAGASVPLPQGEASDQELAQAMGNRMHAAHGQLAGAMSTPSYWAGHAKAAIEEHRKASAGKGKTEASGGGPPNLFKPPAKKDAS